MTRKWIAAGVRADAAEAERRRRAILADRNKNSALRAQHLVEARKRWSAGLMVPYLITAALDINDLYGPEVDAACGVEEPTVDLWELGRVYPTWEQTLKLSELTLRAPRYFMLSKVRVDGRDTSMRFHVPQSVLTEWSEPPVVVFTPEALAASAEFRRRPGGGSCPQAPR